MIYKELFSTLFDHTNRLQLRFHPEIITSDFEQAVIKTIAEEVSIFALFFSTNIFVNFSFLMLDMLAVIFTLQM